MNNKALLLSAGMALVGVFLISEYVSNVEDKARDAKEMVLVLKAKEDIKEMETILDPSKSFRLEAIPSQYKEPLAITFARRKAKAADETASSDDADTTTKDRDSAEFLKNFAGSIAIVPIKKGEQISASKLAEPGMRTGLSPQVSPGKRAFPVPVSEISGIAKLVKPGDRVDVIAVIDISDGRRDAKLTKTVIQDAVVLATGRNVTNNPSRIVESDALGNQKVKPLTEDANFISATLEVEPAQVQMLTLLLAQGENTLYLSLRNNDDTERTGMAGTTIYDVLGSDIGRIPQPRTPAGVRR